MLSKKIYLVLFGLIIFANCSENGTGNEKETLEATLVSDLDANGTSYVFYDLKSASFVANSDSATSKWDIGFKGATIIVNSSVSGPGTAQAQIVSGLFDEYAQAPETGYASDSVKTKAIQGKDGWYIYTGNAETGPEHAMFPIAGKIIVVKNTDKTYSKIQIISYYQGNPNTNTDAFINRDTRPESRFYTFRFVTQSNGTRFFN